MKIQNDKLKKSMKCPRIGEIYQIKFEGKGSVQSGWRPGLIIQNNIGNCFSPNVIAVPLTSVLKKHNQPTHVLLPADEVGLKIDSIVLCENPETVSKSNIREYITDVPEKYMVKIAEAIMYSMPIISYLNEHEVSAVWYNTSRLVLS